MRIGDLPTRSVRRLLDRRRSMSLAKILLCLDTDPQPSVFDGVVAVDAGVDQLFRHGGVTPDAVRDLVYGAMFTRGPADLKNTAVFIGGSDVDAGEKLLAKARECFFGPMRVSLMLDSNGANTTAAAAVLGAKTCAAGRSDGDRAGRDRFGWPASRAAAWRAKAQACAWRRGSWRGRSRFATTFGKLDRRRQARGVRNER